jgi:hypothetical protein
MIQKNFTSGEITQVSFDPTSRYLELVWRNKTVLAFKPVPEEIFRRLCNAPNRAVYYEDRIAEEYPKAQVQRSNAGDAKGKLDNLFI